MSVTVSNKGSQSALCNIYINEVSGILPEWCVSSYERLALNSEHSSEVVFQMKVPVEALPRSYDYTFVVDASEHYLKETPLLHNAKLQVIAPNLNEDE